MSAAAGPDLEDASIVGASVLSAIFAQTSGGSSRTATGAEVQLLAATHALGVLA